MERPGPQPPTHVIALREALLLKAQADEERLLRLQEVEYLTGLKKSALYELMAGGLFPSAVRVGRRGTAWKLSSIRAWIDERPAIFAEEAQ